MKSKPGGFTGNEYRRGALERLSDAFILLRAGQYAGSASAAGRAVEGMMRAVIWKRDYDILSGTKSLETGHSLRDLLKHVRNLGLLAENAPQDADFDSNVQYIARLWFNNMRYSSSKFVESKWYNLGEIHRGQTIKQAAEKFYRACESVVKRCEVLCQK
jgi:HEPN domain-containing protein